MHAHPFTPLLPGLTSVLIFTGLFKVFTRSLLTHMHATRTFEPLAYWCSKNAQLSPEDITRAIMSSKQVCSCVCVCACVRAFESILPRSPPTLTKISSTEHTFLPRCPNVLSLVCVCACPRLPPTLTQDIFDLRLVWPSICFCHVVPMSCL